MYTHIQQYDKCPDDFFVFVDPQGNESKPFPCMNTQIDGFPCEHIFRGVNYGWHGIYFEIPFESGRLITVHWWGKGAKLEITYYAEWHKNKQNYSISYIDQAGMWDRLFNEIQSIKQMERTERQDAFAQMINDGVIPDAKEAA